MASAPKKGVAGLRMEAEATADSNDAGDDRTDAASDNVASLLDSLNLNDEEDDNE